MAGKIYLEAYLVQVSEIVNRVVIIVVTRYEPPYVKVFSTFEEADGAILGITGAHLPELAPISKEIFWSKVEQLKKDDDRLAPMDFGPVLKRLA